MDSPFSPRPADSLFCLFLCSLEMQSLFVLHVHLESDRKSRAKSAVSSRSIETGFHPGRPETAHERRRYRCPLKLWHFPTHSIDTSTSETCQLAPNKVHCQDDRDSWKCRIGHPIVPQSRLVLMPTGLPCSWIVPRRSTLLRSLESSHGHISCHCRHSCKRQPRRSLQNRIPVHLQGTPCCNATAHRQCMPRDVLFETSLRLRNNDAIKAESLSK